eukprot:1394703-Amorphochlora_amoeboformis.AAC.1
MKWYREELEEESTRPSIDCRVYTDRRSELYWVYSSGSCWSCAAPCVPSQIYVRQSRQLVLLVLVLQLYNTLGTSVT